MSHELVNLASAVCSALSAESWPLEFTPARTYDPLVDLEEDGILQVLVTSQDVRRDSIAEGVEEGEYTVEIHLRQIVPAAATAQAIDPLMHLAAAIESLFLGNYATECGNCTAVTGSYLAERMYAYGEFAYVITLTFQVIHQ